MANKRDGCSELWFSLHVDSTIACQSKHDKTFVIALGVAKRPIPFKHGVMGCRTSVSSKMTCS